MKYSTTLSELGMSLDMQAAGTLTKEENHTTARSNLALVYDEGASAGDTTIPDDNRLDHFVERDGVRFAGTHLIIDLWDAARLDDLAHVEATLREAAEVAGATLLNIDLHHFTPNGGVSGLAVLAESHISIHTWPECGYAAIDIFMCGRAEPHKAIPVLRNAFGPRVRVRVDEHRRGII